MNKILLALAILGAGTAGALTARHSTMRLQREANAARESWVVQTQVLADAQGERAGLAERIRELKQNLRQAEAAGNQNDLWSVLETNRIGHLSPDLREHLLDELGFNWNSSEAFIVVSKETVRQMRMHAITGWWPDGDFWHARLIDSAAAVLALTPQERRQVEAAMERVKEDLKDWAISHTERSEPHDDVLAQYTLQSAPPTSISNNIMSEISGAIGKERTELMQMGSSTELLDGSIQEWISELANWGGDKPVTMTLKRFSDGNKQVLKFQERDDGRWVPIRIRFPTIFRPLFPNGWGDVAEREGFELPKETKPK
jgi:hypothetical protein